MPVVRALPGHWRLFQNLRIKAHADVTGTLTSTPERESRYKEQEWRAFLSHCHCFIAYRDNKPVGIGVLRPPGAEPKGVWSVGSIWVDGQYRRIGVSRQILQESIETAREHGATALTALVTEDDPRTEHGYEAMGFERTGNSGPLPNRPLISQVEMSLYFRGPRTLGVTAESATVSL